MKKYIRYLKQATIGIALSTVVGFLLLVLVYMLPQSRISSHIRASTPTICNEPLYFSLMTGVGGSTLDNFTELCYLNLAAVGAEGNPVKSALSGYEYHSPKAESYHDTLELVLENDPSLTKKPSIFRFWNGYLVFLKPLLLLFTYAEIRNLNLMVQCLLMFLLLHLMHEKKLKKYELPLLLTYLLLNPISLVLNMTFAGFFYCTVIPCIIMLLVNDKLMKHDLYFLFFMMIGVCVIYFNMNYFQIITFGIPIVFYFILNGWPKDLRSLFSSGILFFAAWFLGYAGMMVMKWIVYAIFVSPDIFTTIFTTITVRTSSANTDLLFSRADAIQRNIEEITKNEWWEFFEVLFIVSCLAMGLKSRPPLKKWVPQFLIVLILTVIPIIRYFIFANHVFIHCWATYRCLAMAVFAINVFCIDFAYQKRKEV